MTVRWLLKVCAGARKWHSQVGFLWDPWEPVTGCEGGGTITQEPTPRGHSGVGTEAQGPMGSKSPSRQAGGPATH